MSGQQVASPQLIWELSKGFFKRNNPIDAVIKSTLEMVHNLVTFRSKMKLLKYKFMLAQQQLNNMENHVSSNPYNVETGQKINRAF